MILGEPLEGRFALRALRHALEEGRLDLVAHRRLELLAPVVVLLRPAGVADRADIHEGDLHLRC